MSLRRRSYLPEAKGGKRIGYKVMRVEGGKVVAGADSRQSYPLRKGYVIAMPGNGIYLSLQKQYVLDYYSGLADDEVLLTLEFSEKDITTGNLTDRETEVSVKRAKIVSFKRL